MSTGPRVASPWWRHASPAAALTIAALLLSACAHTPRYPAAAHPSTPVPPATVLPHNAPDVSQIPDAIPHDEPRSAFGNPPFYYVGGHRYVVLPSSSGYTERGVASWYGTEFHGLRTSTGEPYDMFAMTAAHKTLPLPCYARVTNLSNGRSIVVRINDRGPFVANRIIDLSYAAATRLEMIRNGTAFVEVDVLSPAAPSYSASLPVNAPAVQAANVGVSSVPQMEPAAGGQPSAPSAPPAAPGAAAASMPAAPLPAAPTAAAATVPRPAVTSGGGFYIQVGAYAKADNAGGAMQRLRAAGISNVFTLAADAHQPLQRVRIGPIASVQQYDATIERLNALGFPNARLAQD